MRLTLVRRETVEAVIGGNPDSGKKFRVLQSMSKKAAGVAHPKVGEVRTWGNG